MGRCDACPSARGCGLSLSDLLRGVSRCLEVHGAPSGEPRLLPGLEHRTPEPATAAQSPACLSQQAGVSWAGGQGAPWEAGLGAHTSKPVDSCNV